MRKYYIIAVITVILFFVNALIPEEVLGCFTRGLVAFIIAVISGIAGIITAIVSIKKRLGNDPTSIQWIIATLIFTIPLVALMFMG